MMKMWNNLYFLISLSVVLWNSGTFAVRHARNLIWAQTPSLKIGVSRIVGIEGDPTEWVPSGNVQVRHISAPHHGWQFKSLAFHYGAQTLYWSESTNKKIQALRLNGTTETETIFTGTSNMAEGIAVDWVSNNIYWTDSLYNWIVMAPLSAQEKVYRLVVRKDLTNPHSVAVHPEKGYLFWTDSGTVSKIEVSDLLGENRLTIIDTDIQHPRGITIDFNDDMLYWVDSKKDTIECAGFLGNNRRVVAYQSATIFFGIAVFQKYLFVTEQMQGHLRVYDKLTGNNEINYQLGYIPDGIIMYDDSLQAGNSSECDAKGCQHICVNDPLYGPKCRCGDGYILDKIDQISCTVGRKFVMPSHIYAIGDAICYYPVNLPDMSLYNVSLDSQCFLQRGRGNFGLTFDAREHMLYYTENVTKSIGRINLVIGEPGASIIKGVGDVQGLALDWSSGNLFWTDLTYNHISMAKKDGMYPSVIIENLDQPFGIAVHPARGKLYWTEQGETSMIFEASMDGSSKRPLVNESQVGTPNHLYLDYTTDRLYWADSGLYSVRCIDLTTGEVTVPYEKISEQVTFFGISFYQVSIYENNNIHSCSNCIHAARLDTLEKVRGILHPHAGMASDIVTFDIHNQPEFKGACDDDTNFCEHLCIPTSNTTYICKCGVGYTLEENMRTCTSSVKTDNYVVTVDSYQKQIYQFQIGHRVTNPFTNTLYWSDNMANVIMKAQVDGFQEEVFKRLPNESISDGIAVDYINQLLFYTCTFDKVIVVVSLKNKDIYKTIVNETLDQPRDIIVHPERGVIYWTDWGKEPKIERATMDGGNRSIIMSLEQNSWPNALALDVKSKYIVFLFESP
ncbi:low-density lipoprotein receptor-related protein 4-like [Ruditapes philippinarum]|uniref:low-density lipoprotein receptor-related protein 4-like n=1 Tax=Ruditapes philippinarum TaxID=129788 RepID=UPI00295ACCB1|nr:low-density lipoprotein receptor-related protein 4-like [Ruditapes philippinarum]